MDRVSPCIAIRVNRTQSMPQAKVSKLRDGHRKALGLEDQAAAPKPASRELEKYYQRHEHLRDLPASTIRKAWFTMSHLLLHPGVRIGARVRIGDRFIAQSGAAIGGDGFSYVTPQPGVVEEAKEAGVITPRERQAYVRVNSLGSVRIGDDVEVGANACIDKGTIADTSIGDGTKIDNLVMVAHNVQVGRGCLLCGHTGIAGSAVIGDRSVLAGRASIADHTVIGKNVVITGNAAVSGHIPDGRIMMGYPGVKRDEFMAMFKAMRRLPRVLARLDPAQKPVPKDDASR